MRVLAIVQARLGSARLPGKALLALAGRPMLDHVLERVSATEGIAEVVMATSCNQRDTEALTPVSWKRNCRTFYDSEWDVLARVRNAARHYAADVVLRVTADCPFWAPDVGSEVVRQFVGLHDLDYLSNDTSWSGYPDGTDTEVFSMQALDRAYLEARSPREREHVTSWMRRNLRTGMVSCATGDYSRMKLSVDRQEDYALALRLSAGLQPGRLELDDTLAAYAALELS